MEFIKREVKKLADKYNLSLVLLFGSQADGKTHSESDFDVSYLADTSLSFDEEVAINSCLIEVFKNNNVQLVNIKKASPLLQKRMVDNCVVLFERKEGVFSELYVYIAQLFSEAKILFDLRKDYLKKVIKQYQNV